MKEKEYDEIDFSAFQCEPIEMTDTEKNNIRRRFMGERKVKKNKMRYVGTAAAAICLGLCITVTALGGIEETFAAVKQLFMGTGEYLGVEEQDDYACVINETQTKGDYTVTLNSVIASDREMRFNVTTETDGEKEDPYAWISEIWIDGKVGSQYVLKGTNNLGEKVIFIEWINAYAPDLPLKCSLTDVDDDFYQSSSEGVTSYELQWYSDETGEAIGEKFVIEIDE